MNAVAKQDKNEVAVAFGQRLRALREAKGWTQAELGERAGMLGHAITRLEAGDRVPSFETLLRLAGALDASLEDFRVEYDSPEPESPPKRKRR